MYVYLLLILIQEEDGGPFYIIEAYGTGFTTEEAAEQFSSSIGESITKDGGRFEIKKINFMGITNGMRRAAVVRAPWDDEALWIFSD